MCIQLFIEEQRDKSHQIISHHNCFVTVIILSKYILEPLTTFPEKGTNATVHPAKKGPAPGNYMGSKNGPSEGHGKGVNKKIFLLLFLFCLVQINSPWGSAGVFSKSTIWSGGGGGRPPQSAPSSTAQSGAACGPPPVPFLPPPPSTSYLVYGKPKRAPLRAVGQRR